MTVWVACPDCDAPAELVDTYEVTGAPVNVLLATTDCANGHRFYGIDAQTLQTL